MKKIIVWGIIFLSFVFLPVFGEVNTEFESIQEETSITPNNEATVTKNSTNEETKSYKQDKKAKNKYVKNVSDIKKLREDKRIKERDLEFLNSRLQIQKQKLEVLQNKKGEN